MNILELFAEKYLNYYDVQSPLNTDIVSNGNCFFHALEYANGDVTQDRAIDECIKASRRDVTDLYINLLDSEIVLHENELDKEYVDDILKKELKKFISTNETKKEKMEKFKGSNSFAKEAIIRQGVIHKEKALFILKTDKKDPASLSFQILTTEKIGINFNINNILFLINEISNAKGVHFITFRNSECRRVVPNRLFIEAMNEIIRIPEIAIPVEGDSDNIMEYIFHIQDFDREILKKVRIKLNSPPVAQGLSLSGSIQEEYNKMAAMPNQSSPHSTVSSITNSSYNQFPEGISLTDSLKEAEGQFAKQVSLNNETPENERRILVTNQPLVTNRPWGKFPIGSRLNGNLPFNPPLGSRLNGNLPFNPPLGSRLNGNLPWGKKTRNNNSTNSSASRNRYRRDTGLVAVKKQGKTKNAKPPPPKKTRAPPPKKTRP